MVVILSLLDIEFKEQNILGIEEKVNYLSEKAAPCDSIDCIPSLLNTINDIYFFIQENITTLILPFVFVEQDTVVKYATIKYNLETDIYSILLSTHLPARNYIGVINNIFEESGNIDIYQLANARNEVLTLGLPNQLTSVRHVLMTLHSLAYLFDIKRLELYDIATVECRNEYSPRPILISFSRKLAGLSYYYQQFGYQVTEDNLQKFVDAEYAFTRLRSLPIQPFFSVLNLNFNGNATLGEYFQEFNNRNPNLPCPNTTDLLNLLFNHNDYFEREDWNREVRELMNPIRSFLGFEENFYYTTSYNDLTIITG